MGKSLRELMSSRGKGQSSKAPAKAQTQDPPPIAPQVPSDPGLKVNPDLKKKRQADIPEEGEMVPRPAKQQKATKGQRSKRANSSESRDEENRAEVRVTPQKFKESKKRRKSAEASLKSAESQAEDQHKELYSTQINLATEKQAVLDLKVALQKVEDELRRVKEEAQLIREAAEAEKSASRIPADSALRLPENIFYPEEIQENPDGAQTASEQDLAVPDAVPVPDKAKDPALGVPEDSPLRDPSQVPFPNPEPAGQDAPAALDEEETASMRELVEQIDSHAEPEELEATSIPTVQELLDEAQPLTLTVQQEVPPPTQPLS
ncbi:uncharacterized protein LOC126722192 [Quercus robur]|uniref:uncharacterized protein LOC126722192 n=1 Tax=Quercus robur TaxID=38942 RepID=UPI0021630D13|nr:uncharacterized protein LOC126722192 [Quercus robur]